VEANDDETGRRGGVGECEPGELEQARISGIEVVISEE